MNRCLWILILSQIVTEAFQGVLDMPRPHELGPGSFQNRSDLIGERGVLQQVRSLGARSELDAFAFAEAC